MRHASIRAPASAKARYQAKTCAYTVSTRVPSRSKIKPRTEVSIARSMLAGPNGPGVAAQRLRGSSRRLHVGPAGDEEPDRRRPLSLEVEDLRGTELVSVGQQLRHRLRHQDPARLPAGLQTAGQVHRVPPQVVGELPLAD